jgi:hypothetical protein
MHYLSARVRARAATLPTTTKRFYRMKAGDNLAEGTFSTIKRNLVRMNLQRSTENASINFLASSWLAKNCGIRGVASGVKAYQEVMMDSGPPKEAFKTTKWLRSLEPME